MEREKMNEIKLEIFSFISDFLISEFPHRIDGSDILPGSHLKNDLGLDSLDCQELFVAVEEKYYFRAPDEWLDNIKTIEDLISLAEINRRKA